MFGVKARLEHVNGENTLQLEQSTKRNEMQCRTTRLSNRDSTLLYILLHISESMEPKLIKENVMLATIDTALPSSPSLLLYTWLA